MEKKDCFVGYDFSMAQMLGLEEEAVQLGKWFCSSAACSTITVLTSVPKAFQATELKVHVNLIRRDFTEYGELMADPMTLCCDTGAYNVHLNYLPEQYLMWG